MKASLSSSELILNADGSIYHLNLLPEDIADIIITVGDPERVSEVSKHFDSIEIKKGKREFITHTGMYVNKRITVISTGIGTDNIDIVFNELDALINIDFASRKVKTEKKQLPPEKSIPRFVPIRQVPFAHSPTTFCPSDLCLSRI